MRKKNRDFWYKDEDQNNFISSRGEFASPEIENARDGEADADQWKAVIRYAVINGYPDFVFCTPVLSAADLRTIIRYGYEDEELKQYPIPEPIEVWKISRSGLNFEQLRISLIALRLGLILTDKIRELNKCSVEVLWWITFAHKTCNANVCNWVNNGKSDREIIEGVQKLYKKRGRKEKRLEILDRMMYYKNGK